MSILEDCKKIYVCLVNPLCYRFYPNSMDTKSYRTVYTFRATPKLYKQIIDDKFLEVQSLEDLPYKIVRSLRLYMTQDELEK